MISAHFAKLKSDTYDSIERSIEDACNHGEYVIQREFSSIHALKVVRDRLLPLGYTCSIYTERNSREGNRYFLQISW